MARTKQSIYRSDSRPFTGGKEPKKNNGNGAAKKPAAKKAEPAKPAPKKEQPKPKPKPKPQQPPKPKSDAQKVKNNHIIGDKPISRNPVKPPTVDNSPVIEAIDKDDLSFFDQLED